MVNDDLSKLLISKDIYSDLAVSMTISAFEYLCKIDIVDNDTYWTCLFRDCKLDFYLTIKEFENYLIGMSRQNDF